MSDSISPDGLSAAIMSEMDRFKKVSSQALDKAANECADEAVKRLKESSPVGPSKKHYAKGWKKEVNLVSWNDAEPKFDIRSWSEDHSRMGKGITLSDEEVSVLLEVLKKSSISPIVLLIQVDVILEVIN